MFADRLDAGRQLAETLTAYKNCHGVVLGVPRGGVPVAYEVAHELNLPMDLVLAKKIGHPFNKEFAIGAVSLTDSIVSYQPGVDESYIKTETEAVREKLRSMKKRFAVKDSIDLKNKTVIIVDDGIATGNTLMATIQLLRKQHPAKIIVAVPIAPPQAVYKLQKVADDVITVLTESGMGSIGAYYEDFHQMTDEEVQFFLDKKTNEELIAD